METHLCSRCVLLLHLFALLSTASSDQDSQLLLTFKTASDISDKLSWNSSTDLCTWHGVFCYKDQLRRLVLEDLNLTGSFQSLAALSNLRVLSLKRNSLSGPLPDFSKLTTLKLLFLSNNHFSGTFPASLSYLIRLRRLDLSHNNLSGQIPLTINQLTHLLTLRLESNHFSGKIPHLNLPNLRDFNVSGNFMNGKIPELLSIFPDTAFSWNYNLCGSPLRNCEGNNTDTPLFDPDSAVKPTENANSSIAQSSPSLKPIAQISTGHHHNRSMSHFVIVLIAVGDTLVLAVLCLFLYCYFSKSGKGGKWSHHVEGEKMVYSSSPYHPQACADRERMVFFEGVKHFELEDLMRASAEMLGKGNLGTTYKANLDGGNFVAVKRLREMQVVGKSDFEQRMKTLGQLRHPNIVELKAYFYSRDEKMLVYDYMPKGSLFSLLHGNRGPSRPPPRWTKRIRIATGAARGLAFIHDISGPKFCHGNMKSTNILIDKAGNARVADFGVCFAVPVAASTSRGYRAPELTEGGKSSQKADVYAFGVVLLEMLTAKSPSTAEGDDGVVDLPRWVQSVVKEGRTTEVLDLEIARCKEVEEDITKLLKLALDCTSVVPGQRPEMKRVVTAVEQMLRDESPPSEPSDLMLV